jgi:hypothetical protein
MPAARCFRLWLVMICASFALQSQAAEIDGVWASDAAQCGKIFHKSKGQVAFTKNSDIYGAGLIVGANDIAGKTARCGIRSRKVDGSTVHISASCTTDVMLSDVRLSLKIIDENRIARVFPDVSDMEMYYQRCVLK